MLKQAIELELRNDEAGLGHFGAPRGSHTHRGIDFACTPGSPLLSPVEGVVTRHGYCYKDDPKWRYVEITSFYPGEEIVGADLRHRFLYTRLEPRHMIGGKVEVGEPVGIAQDIAERYPGRGMKPHVHVEIKNQKGEYLDPCDYGY